MQIPAVFALRYTSAFVDVRKSAGIIMDTLPVCEVRKISYSAFSIVDIVDLGEDGEARVIEHGNPALILLRGGEPVETERAEITLENWKDRATRYAEFTLQVGDRIVCHSDGISQSGLGRQGFPLGWGQANVSRREVAGDAEISAYEPARKVVGQAFANDGSVAKDDMTCSVIFYRRPGRLLIATGPPFCQDRDRELAELVLNYPGRKSSAGAPQLILYRGCSNGRVQFI